MTFSDRVIALVLLAWAGALPMAAPVMASEGDAKRQAPTPAGGEFLEMLWMILSKGSDMGPNDGWFHPSQIRLGWADLKQRDKDGDGSISASEFGGPVELFVRLDRDRDGGIKPDDFDWSPQSPYVRQQAAVRRQFVMMDTNSNGKISRDEWDAFFARATNGQGGLTAEGLGAALSPPPPAPPEKKGARARPPASAGPSRWTLLAGLFKGELGSRFEGPALGAAAPDFTLKSPDGKEEITLSKYRAGKPVVLVFGSFT